MRAAVAGLPGQVQIVEFPEPKLAPGELILAPLACGICSTDVKLVQRGAEEANYALGHELAGRVVAASQESRWSVGQRVVAVPYLPCGECFYCRHAQPTLCGRLFDTAFLPGALAEEIWVPSRISECGLFSIPDDLPDEIAALAEPVGCVVKGIQDANLQPGDTVLVVGDGPMGLFCATVARAYGAARVLVAGLTPSRLACAGEYYADQIIDLNQEELVGTVQDATEGRGADVVMVAVSDGEALLNGIKAVRPGGTVNAFAGVSNGVQIPLDVRKLHYQQFFLTGSFGLGPEHMAKALQLLGSGRIDVAPLITARFPFESVAEAVAYAADRTGLKPVVIF
jgi:L-iditol 2-dehydrogenase